MDHIHTPKVEGVHLVDNYIKTAVKGTLYLTATHLIFVDNSHKKEKWLLHSHIQTLEKLATVPNGLPLLIRCKTFEVFTFVITQEKDYNNLYSSLVKLSKPVKMEDLYAFSYNPRGVELTQQDGWDLFGLKSIYSQMGLPTRYWKLSRINNDFGLCETYPKLLCVPSLATPALMVGSAAFRSKRRLPILSYLHKNGSFIVRCSQPMAGFNSRSIEDESFVDLIRRSKSEGNNLMYIVDTRPMINAVANRAQGKGYENTDRYENIKYRFLGIENIHVMRSSLNKMLEACEDSTVSVGTWLEAINSSGWLKHVHNVIQVSRFIANKTSKLHLRCKAVAVERRSVMVHCSDGWDRTAQTCALASIMLNPRYRTIEGFLALIQKDWIQFGHKFEHRCGHLDFDVRETSPVFTQFLDAVWQLMRLKPCSFQFNEHLLLDLHDHAYSCQFGTFLGNSAKARQTYSLPTRTYSLWGWMMKRRDVYTNPLFKPTDQNNIEGQLILPPPTPQFVKLWTGMYNRFDKSIQPKESVASIVKALHGETVQLTKDLADMKSRSALLQEMLKTEDNIPISSTKEQSRTLSPISSLKPEEAGNANASKQFVSALTVPGGSTGASSNKKLTSLGKAIVQSSCVAISAANCSSSPELETQASKARFSPIDSCGNCNDEAGSSGGATAQGQTNFNK